MLPPHHPEIAPLFCLAGARCAARGRASHLPSSFGIGPRRDYVVRAFDVDCNRMSKPKTSNELPDTISLTTLRWILGDVTTEYCNQLQRQGVLEKVSRGTYTTASVRSYIRAMRERTLGPQAWN